VALAAALGLYCWLAYGSGLGLEFVGDDYVFLDRVLGADFRSLWSFENTDFGWYRPWSRELHFWSMTRLWGVSPLMHRAANLAIWILTLLLYFRLIARLVPWPGAPIAVFAVASLALWGTPILWVSGSQDLWMLFFAVLAVLLVAEGRHRVAAIPVGLALLSKETAIVLPAILLSYALVVERARVLLALTRLAPVILTALAWLLLHPTLRSRFFDPAEHSVEAATRPPLPLLLLRATAANLNLDQALRPEEVSVRLIVMAALSALLVSGAAAAIARWGAQSAGVSDRPPEGRVVVFGLTWAALGSLPLLLPSIGWHAYYGCLGVLGAWLAMAIGLSRRPAAAFAIIGVLALLRAASAETPSWDWGNAWYQRRAASVVTAIRSELLARYPSLPPHTRVYFGRVPNNIGLVAGRSPAVRVWYGDPTLSADFCSGYRPRQPGEPSGADLFFRFDSLRTLVEIGNRNEDPVAASRERPDWVDDHQKLALLFLNSGDPRAAAEQFERISRLPSHPDHLVLAALSRQAAGDSARASMLLRVAAVRLRRTPAEIAEMARELAETMPGPAKRP